MALPQTIMERAGAIGPRRIQQAIVRLQSLPAFYPVVQKALHLLEDPESNNSHIQQVVSSDQALAARILKLANSAYFGFHSQVRTISLAITLIGREKISTLLRRFLAEEMFGMLSGRKPAASEIRRVSLATAAAAHLLAERLLRNDKEELLLAGLLHNVGDLVLLSQFRYAYEDMLHLSEELPRAEAETSIFGVESRLVGKWLVEAWNFPLFFTAVIEHHADPWQAYFPAAPLGAIVTVHLARKMAEAWRANVKEDDRPKQAETFARSLSPRILGTLEINRQFVADAFLQLPERIEGALGTVA